jgi:hypothetical protein
MTTIAYHQYTNIPYLSGTYASAPVNAPLSTNQTPLQMPKHNYGVLTGLHPNPPQFYPADGASEFSNSRRQYLRTHTTQYNMGTGTVMHSPVGPTSVYNADTQRSYLLSQATKYNAPKDSSQYISARKAAAVGQSSFKQGLPTYAPLSYKSFDRNDVKTILGRVRRAGCNAPAKKGSIYNTSLTNNDRGAGWGALVSQNY